jgi:hypothetical protein
MRIMALHPGRLYSNASNAQKESVQFDKTVQFSAQSFASGAFGKNVIKVLILLIILEFFRTGTLLALDKTPTMIASVADQHNLRNLSWHKIAFSK